MPVSHRLTIENVRLDDERELDALDQQVIDAGMERVRGDREKLCAKGLPGKDGKLRLPELPEDMLPDLKRDFGG